MIDLTEDLKKAMTEALNDIGSKFPLDDEEIRSIVRDVTEYIS